MSVLQNIQLAVLDELARTAELSNVSLSAEGITPPTADVKSACRLTVMLPEAQSCARYGNRAVLKDIDLCVEIAAPKFPESGTPRTADIAECVCKRLHNMRAGMDFSRGCLTLRAKTPIERGKARAGGESCKIHFMINNVIL